MIGQIDKPVRNIGKLRGNDDRRRPPRSRKNRHFLTSTAQSQNERHKLRVRRHESDMLGGATYPKCIDGHFDKIGPVPFTGQSGEIFDNSAFDVKTVTREPRQQRALARRLIWITQIAIVARVDKLLPACSEKSELFQINSAFKCNLQ